MGRGAGGGGRTTETIKGDTYKQNTACTRRKMSKTPLCVQLTEAFKYRKNSNPVLGSLRPA